MTDFCLCAGVVWFLLIVTVVFFVWLPVALSGRISEEERRHE